MSEQPKVGQPKYSAELQDAVERTLKAHDLRCRPGIGLDTVLETLEANHVTPSVSYGQLQIEMPSSIGTPQAAHVAPVIEALAKQRSELFYPRSAEGVQSKSDCDLQAKIAVIREMGLEHWEKLPLKAQTEQPVVLDPRRLTKKDWLGLDRKTKIEFVKTYGDRAVEQIMGRAN